VSFQTANLEACPIIAKCIVGNVELLRVPDGPRVCPIISDPTWNRNADSRTDIFAGLGGDR
jgi:hypothetical protein